MTKILIEIDTDTQRVVQSSLFDDAKVIFCSDSEPNTNGDCLDVIEWFQASTAAAPQPESVDADLRRDAELWRAHQKRKQDLIDRGFLRNPLRAAPQDCLAETVTIDAAMSQGEQK